MKEKQNEWMDKWMKERINRLMNEWIKIYYFIASAFSSRMSALAH